MFKIFYSIVLSISAILYAPYFFYQMLVKGKYRKSTLARLGFGFPKLNPKETYIWVHGVSVGEAKAISPLIKKIKNDNPNIKVIFSTITETGLAEAKKSSPEADYLVYLPFDFVIRGIVKRVKPKLLILCETDFWFNFMDAAKKEGAKIIVVNGKLSERSRDRFKIFPWFTENLFNLIDLIICQNPLYKDRFESLGIDPKKLVVGGNIKLDSDPAFLNEGEIEAFKGELKVGEGPVIVVGSTHDPEEKHFLKAFKEVKKEYPKAQLILVPRHPERFDQVAKIIEDFNLPYSRLSKTIQEELPVILIDGMGRLKKCYQIATITAVAGSWTEKVGGHNILEPSFYGKAVVYGPYLHTQPDFKTLMKDYQGGVQVEPEEIAETLIELLKNPTQRERLGSNGKRMVAECQGALNRTYDYIKQILLY